MYILNFRVDIYLSALFFYAVKKYFIIIICCQSLENNRVLFSEIGIETRTYPIGVTSINVTDLLSQHEKDGYVRIVNVYPTQNFLLVTCSAHPVPGTNVIERYITIDNRYTSPIAAALIIDITYIPT